MSSSRFSADYLHYLRNQIPIDKLIENLLKAPGMNRHGAFYFFCPLCKSGDTSIKKETNLARCFTCRKNFNPIDLVMAVKGLKFVAAVGFLQTHIDDINAVAGPEPNPTNRKSPPSLNTLRPSLSQPTSMGQILPAVLTRIASKKISPETCCDGCLSLEQRLVDAEKQLIQLKLLVSKLQIMITE